MSGCKACKEASGFAYPRELSFPGTPSQMCATFLRAWKIGVGARCFVVARVVSARFMGHLCPL